MHAAKAHTVSRGIPNSFERYPYYFVILYIFTLEHIIFISYHLRFMVSNSNYLVSIDLPNFMGAQIAWYLQNIMDTT